MRSSRDSSSSCSAAAKACTTRRRRARACGSSSRPDTGDACASASSCSRSRSSRSRFRRCSAATGRGAIPDRRAGWCRSSSSRSPSRARRAEPGQVGRRGVGARGGDLHEQHRRDVLRVRGRAAARVGTLYVLLQNGVMLGVVAGLAIGSGNGRVFFELVTAHGVLELSCIVVSGAAGLRLGWAIIDPGQSTTRRGAAPRSAPRSRWCSAPRRGSSSRVWSKGFSRPRAPACRPCSRSGSRWARSTGGWCCGAAAARGHSRARDLSRRYARTHASPSSSGDASITVAPWCRRRFMTWARPSSTSSATAPA